ncbi:DUF2249 domain-containing protein [Salinibaculum rarum]|uniref:DUF2249 domain-containing protein n=1 Tax=Salinibaculum rarum TaxID=3058903 RepID=UPI00265FE273|nr:DUF2249 domain-containing protein [Salinibaculum sp. KK48]
MSAKPFGEADKTVDAREIDGEPFGEIMTALEDLSADEALLLINSFEPEPLYAVIDERGFEHETANPASDEWHVKITQA